MTLAPTSPRCSSPLKRKTADFGAIDIVASATGKIVPSGRTKVIQPFETGVADFTPPADADPALITTQRQLLLSQVALITGIAGCCARAASGHATVVPPSSEMKSRRLLRNWIRCFMRQL